VVAATGVGTTDDDWRDELLTATVDQVELAVTDGVPVTGLFHDSLVDGYEWTRGFDAPRGLVTRDRRLKESGRNLSQRITGHPPGASLS
jgi:beta-glucosidase/6-phospho-beta-glucosidase/beta-galactosidase